MPNLTAHIDIAMKCATELCHPVLELNLGSFILGSCSPDIRIITRERRDDTHFAPITNQVIGMGAKNLFKAYPRLAKAANLSQRTQAFMAGYISHLVADESWITRVYHPYFVGKDIFHDGIVANVMDRAIQLDMDRAAVDKSNGFEHIRNHLEDAHIGVTVDFLSSETLADWREWVIGITQREFSWERLLFMTWRQYPQDDGTAQTVAEQFLESLPESLEDLYEYVPREAIRSYEDTAVQEWSKIVREYLP